MARKPDDLTVVWYVESDGVIWQEPSLQGGTLPDEAYHATGNHELWVMDHGSILARATAGMMACALTRPAFN